MNGSLEKLYDRINRFSASVTVLITLSTNNLTTCHRGDDPVTNLSPMVTVRILRTIALARLYTNGDARSVGPE